MKNVFLRSSASKSRVGQYCGTVTRYFFNTVIGTVDTLKKCTVFGTVVTFQTVLLDISVTFFE